MKSTIITLVALLIVIGAYVLGVRHARQEPIAFVGLGGTEKYVETDGRTLILHLKTEGLYCGSRLLSASKEMEEIDQLVREHNAARFYIVGGDEVKYGNFVGLAERLRAKYHFHIVIHMSDVTPGSQLPELMPKYE